MEINPLSSFFHTPEGRRKAVEGDTPPVAPQTDSYVGPNTEAKIEKLKTLESSRPELIEFVQTEIKEQRYLNDDRIKSTIEQLLNYL
jgi:hypothetical protein